MDVERLSHRWPDLISYLEAHSYSPAWRRMVKHLIRQVLGCGSDPAVRTYLDFYSHIEKMYNPRRLGSIRAAINQIAYFDQASLMPDRKRKSIFEVSPGYSELTLRYRNLTDALEQQLKAEQLRPSTVYGYRKTAIHFFHHLQNRKITKLHDVTEGDVLSYFYADGQLRRGFKVAENLRRVMKTLEPLTRKGDCARIIRYLPKSVRTRKPASQLTTDEVNRIKDAVLDDTNGLSYRDRAVVTLALYAALRCQDIAALTFADVDFKRETITLSRQGTDKNVIPLRPVVGNSLYDYIKHERPESDSETIFLTTHTPPLPISTNGLRAIAGHVYDVAKVRTDGKGRGFQPIRRAFAITLLGDGVPTPYVKSILGNATPNSVNNYLVSGYEQLKRCGLDISRWPIGKEALEDV